jgi:DNA-directed RNA polymerase specialized sigma24 family protein
MKLPSNMTETQVVEIMQKVVNLLAPSFRFGCYDVDDIKQEGMTFAIQAMDKYDESRPLENFLYSHIKNRLINLKRDRYKRNDSPCTSCHNAIDGYTEHQDGKYCEKYIAWYRRNSAKQNLMHTIDISTITQDRETKTKIADSAVYEVEVRELVELVDEFLPAELRASLLQMRAGQPVPKARRLEVERAVQDILKDEVQCLTHSSVED